MGPEGLMSGLRDPHILLIGSDTAKLAVLTALGGSRRQSCVELTLGCPGPQRVVSEAGQGTSQLHPLGAPPATTGEAPAASTPPGHLGSRYRRRKPTGARASPRGDDSGRQTEPGTGVSIWRDFLEASALLRPFWGAVRGARFWFVALT